MKTKLQSSFVIRYSSNALLTAFALCLTTLRVSGQTVPYTYTTNNDTITITGYTGSGGDVTIPDMIGDLPVTRIGTNAFSVYPLPSNLNSVTIPDSVTDIGPKAFFYCRSLTSIIIGNGVTNIGSQAFDTCDSLTGVTIPDGVVSIGNLAFSACDSLTRVTIPDSVTSLGVWAFIHCRGLTNAIVVGVTSIGTLTFDDCPKLTSVTIGNSVTNIGDQAFGDCTNLTWVYFKGNAPSLGSEVFFHDTNAIAYYLPGTTGWAAFDEASGLGPAVLVNDTTPPVITCPTNLVATAQPGQCDATVTFSVTASDDWDPAPSLVCMPPSGSTFPVGRTTVHCTAWDASGNTNTSTFTVSVYPTRLAPAGEIWTPHESNRQWWSVASSADGTKLVATVYGGGITTVRFRNRVNIGDFADWLVGLGVEAEKEPVKWAFSRKG